MTRISEAGETAASIVSGTPPNELIRSIRTSLRMSQTQLAKRAGLPQSHLALIELGRIDVQIGTLKRIFQALFCELVILPKMTKRPDAVVIERAKIRARENVARVSGTMSLEKQTPDEDAVAAMIRSEESRLLNSDSSEIWND